MHDDGPEILLTNDDGIQSPGIEALRDALLDVGDVTVVAPATDQSAVGRAISYEADVDDHPWGYAIEGTPSDCVVAGLGALVPDADIVVSGANKGANLGMYVLGRSGTVSAAVESTFFGVPAVATSLYVQQGDADFETVANDVDDYRTVAAATAHIVERGLATNAFEEADYLNVNGPRPSAASGDMRITTPSLAYDMDAHRDGHTVHLTDRMWQRMAHGEVPDEDGQTDRKAVVEGAISVSPLTAPHSTEGTERLGELAAAYRGRHRGDS
ncbi:MAG: 5'/3'-nucleotidase SurE [Halobacteriaceae archaeon]